MNRSYIPDRIIPSPKQLEFLIKKDTEALFASACGGGKTTALLMAALEYVDQPEYRALIVRQSHLQLACSHGLIDTTKEWFGNRATFKKHQLQWEFPSGAKLNFASVRNDDDVYRLAGGEWSGIFIDEASGYDGTPKGENDTEHKVAPYIYQYLLTRLRTPKDSIIPLRMRLAASWHGLGKGWLRERFTGKNAKGSMVSSGPEDNPEVDGAQWLQLLKETAPTLLETRREG